MNSTVLLYCKKILNELRTLAGGVLNIQSNVTILQNDVTNLKNIPMIANQSAVRTSQKGTANQSVSVSTQYDSNMNFAYGSYSVNIPITAIANASKCWLDHDITVSASGMASTYLRIRNVSVTLYTTYIRVSFEAMCMADRTLSASVYGDWQLIEFY